MISLVILVVLILILILLISVRNNAGTFFLENNNSYNVLCDRRVHINQRSLASLFLFWRFLGRRTLVNTIN